MLSDEAVSELSPSLSPQGKVTHLQIFIEFSVNFQKKIVELGI